MTLALLLAVSHASAQTVCKVYVGATGSDFRR